jgi:hypothetical protein
MAPSKVRIPKVGNRVGSFGHNGVFVVVTVHTNPDVVDLRLLDSSFVERDIPWTTLVYLDEEDVSQAAVRIVREATDCLTRTSR